VPESLNAEIITILVSLLGGLGTMLSLAWVKLVKPLIDLLKNQEYFKDSVEQIRKELQTNGGNSLKDAVISLGDTCGRIETRQRIIEQRTKAALHYSNIALFETDDDGRLIWNNMHLCDLTSNEVKSLEGYDWVNCIDEEEREEVLTEFLSCVNMNRKFNRSTKTINGKKIRMIGYPYKLSEERHGGFLVSVSLINEV
jgi:hypothetical protein